MSGANSPTGGSTIRAFGLPLRSKAATERLEPDLVLPSPPPPLRDGVTEVHYSRWVVEEANKEIGDETREEMASHKKYRKELLSKFLTDQHRKASDARRRRAYCPRPRALALAPSPSPTPSPAPGGGLAPSDGLGLGGR